MPRAVDDTMTLRERASRFSAAQRRTAAAALDLFAEFGVPGTSLQMIADAVGVTKAAIYHQFKTKESIVLAVAEIELVLLETALEAAEAEPSRAEARAALLTQVIDLAIERRRWINALQGDPVMIRLLGSHEPFVELMTRLYALLLGEDTDPAGRMRAAIVSAAVGGAIVHPLVADLDDETLRAELLAVTSRLFELPQSPRSTTGRSRG